MCLKKVLCFTFITILFTSMAIAQREPDPNVGNIVNTRWGTMDGNLVRTVFANHGEIANWDQEEWPSGEWPKGSGHTYVDGVALIVAAPIVDANGKLQHSVMTRYREDMDESPEGIPWGFAPLPGYFNPDPNINITNSPAISERPETWPDFWPDRPMDWAGEWNGFFGKKRNADLEAYMVFDDDPDEEFLFYPDPSDSSRRGLGIEVASRLFQWNQVLAQDVIFAIYFITNEAKTDYDSTYFAFHIDWGIGGHHDSADDGGNYDLDLDIAWAFDGNGYGSPYNWSPVGVAGFAFLESPGIYYDGRDNDNDGLIDEKRDSGPGYFIDTAPDYGIDNPQKFREVYPQIEFRPHWSGDENMNWDPYMDLNENGVWDAGEPLMNDVGADGLGPTDSNYPGPDEGEGDGIPTAGEPDFDFNDKDESDQLGLIGFNVFNLHDYQMQWDDSYWNAVSSAPPPRDKLVQNVNLGMFFSSGPFKLHAGDTQFYSMALLFGEDKFQLQRTKNTIQQIYNATYQFAEPPDQSRLTAVSGDGRVVLYWDNRAESSFDDFLQEFDFEGYRIYRATEAEFLETQTITNAYGKKIYKLPIAQFDLDNGIRGLHPIDTDGVKFNLGNDTGLRHLYVDTDVTNGQTYYYALVPYDRGHVDTTVTGEIAGIQPSESPSVIKVSAAGVVEYRDINTAIVVPQAPSSGYKQPYLADGIQHDDPGTGTVEVGLLDPGVLLDNNSYELVFYDSSKYASNPNPWFDLINLTSRDTLFNNVKLVDGEYLTSVAQGFSVNIQNTTSVEPMYEGTGWISGEHEFLLLVAVDSSLIGRFTAYPADFELSFYENIVDTSQALLFGQKAIPVNFMIYNLTEGRQVDFIFNDKDQDEKFSVGDWVTIVIGDSLGAPLPASKSKFKTAWSIFFDVSSNGHSVSNLQAGDIYRFTTSKPFRNNERFRFTVRRATVNVQEAKNQLDNITVVPNPYVAAASWEPKSIFGFGRGERRIYFNNLPSRCTIRIYTVRGFLVDLIEHDSAIELGSESWDLVSKDGMDIAYGIYIYHVDAPGIGTHIGKFAVIK